MARFAIGDIQGCAIELRALLRRLKFSADRDQLWFVGDLVNRGPASLKALRRIRALGEAATVILGKPPTLSPRSSMAGAATTSPLVIEEGAAICAQAIVFAGSRVGRGTIVGDQAFVRERSVIGY